MANVAVVGAGHAGVEAAFTLAKAGVKVVLYTNEPRLPYFRPRLISVAFGQATPEAIVMKPMGMYEQAGIELRHEAVTQLEVASRQVNGQVYDGVILAQGSQPFVPPFAGSGASRVMSLWSMEDALKVRQGVDSGVTLAIIGGGVLGLEAALRAALAGMRVTVIEVAPALLGGCLGPQAEAVLRKTFEAKGITLKLGCNIREITADAIEFVDGTQILAQVILGSTGARPNITLAQSSGVAITRGIACAADLSIAPGVYAAGDQASPSQGRPVCAVMRAMRMGALAAKNLLAAWQGQSAQTWEEPVLPLFMKVDDVEFHTVGDCFATDVMEERIDDATVPTIWKSVLKRDGKVVGLRWVGTRAGFADWEKQLVRM